MTKQEEIREGIAKIICCLNPQECANCKKCPDEWEDVAEQVDEVLTYLHSQGVVIKVERELPYKWSEFTKKHSYHPFKEFTSYILENKHGKMFGYIQKEEPLYESMKTKYPFDIYLGDAEWAHSWECAKTLSEAKKKLIKEFLSSRDNPDKGMPAGLVAVEALIEERK